MIYASIDLVIEEKINALNYIYTHQSDIRIHTTLQSTSNPLAVASHHLHSRQGSCHRWNHTHHCSGSGRGSHNSHQTYRNLLPNIKGISLLSRCVHFVRIEFLIDVSCLYKHLHTSGRVFPIIFLRIVLSLKCHMPRAFFLTDIICSTYHKHAPWFWCDLLWYGAEWNYPCPLE